jgi:hypothetical protein
MFDWIKNIFRKDIVDNINSDILDMPIGDQTNFIWCLIGNIVDERPYVEIPSK